jgi:hypothetical protein
MLTILTLAVMASLLLGVRALRQPPTAPPYTVGSYASTLERRA